MEHSCHCLLDEWAASQLRVRNSPNSEIHTLLTLLRGETKDRGCESNVCDLVLWDVFVSHLFSPGVRNSCHGDRVPRVTKAWGDNVSDREWSKIQPKVVKAQRTSSCQQADWLTIKKQFQIYHKSPLEIFSKLFKMHFCRSYSSLNKNKCNSNPSFSLCGHRLPFKSKNRNTEETKSPP